MTLSSCSQILRQKVIDTPAYSLLNLVTEPSDMLPDSTLEKHLLNAAKILIPNKWKMVTPPSISEWLKKVNKLAKFEELSARTEKQKQNFRDTWLRWFLFKETDTYKQHS
ncbi:hypothetical protein XELAEV_18002081mg [Xenopus laevis]|nr:hypothetical protein XELAEV_18002081mg [Xenopus laevis]